MGGQETIRRTTFPNGAVSVINSLQLLVMFAEWFLVTLLLAGAGFLVFAGRMRASGAVLCAALFTLAGLAPVWWWQTSLRKKLDSRAQLTVPQVGRPEDYAGAASCRACHPDQYASWHRSFHRTMTQIASRESVRGDFKNVTLELDGERYSLEHRDDEFWVDLVDPDWKLHPAAAMKGSGSAASPVLANPPRA